MFKALKKLRQFNKLPEEQRRFIFFSEGPTYYGIFSPVISEFLERGIPFVYLTLDSEDPGFKIASENVSTFCLGRGTGFIYFMSMIKAGVVIMTTPGLQSLTLKRSPGALHYVHLVHSPVSISSYRKFSFDHFNTIMCSGSHQIGEIRKLEQIRSTPKKNLLETGCSYMDLLKQRVDKSSEQKKEGTGVSTVLIAPTWGSNGLLGRYGMDLIKPLVDAGFEIIIRPHPQQLQSEKSLIVSLRKAAASFPIIRWDENPSGHDSMVVSDIMISDLSGVIFDYAFIYEKPVITLDFPLETEGFEQEDLNGPVWELDMREKLGAVVSGDNLELIPGKVKKVLSDRNSTEILKSIRSDSLFNYGSVGKVAADQLIEIAKSLQIR